MTSVDEPPIRIRRHGMTVYEGMLALGLEGAKKGQIMLTQKTSAKGNGINQRWHWRFTKVRVKGEPIWRTRAGVLSGARVTTINGGTPLVQFYIRGWEPETGITIPTE